MASPESRLALGWQVNDHAEPKFWRDASKNPKSGGQIDTDLVWTPATAMASHTAIIAQSGSGKSFFLGRIIEEIALNTLARCVILDPNGDFRKIDEVAPISLWQEARYDVDRGRGKLPHETSRDLFNSRWSRIRVRVRGGPALSGKNRQPFKLSWASLDMAFFAEDIPAIRRPDLQHCHAFVKALASVLHSQQALTGKAPALIAAAQELFAKARRSKAELREHISEKYNPDIIFGPQWNDNAQQPYLEAESKNGFTRIFSRTSIESAYANFKESAQTLTDYVSRPVERFYFGKAHEYDAAGILQTNIESELNFPSRRPRIEVIDLPSFPDLGTRQLAINSLLSTEWDRARSQWSRALEQPEADDRRVPTFIVVDEAHNLMASETTRKPALALKEQFRTIAAEGRKYGIFLILVTQRPDKVDPLILSECENRALMRLGSQSVLELTTKLMGLDDLQPRIKEKCLEFGASRALLVGPWANNGVTTLYSAARRTVEGGRNLRSEHWAMSPFDSPSPALAVMADSAKRLSVTRPRRKVTRKPKVKSNRRSSK